MNLNKSKMRSLINNSIDKNQKSIYHGLVIVILSLLMVFRFAVLYYQYNYTDILFNFMYSDSILGTLIILSILSLLIGLSVIFKKQNYKTAYLEVLIIFIFGVIIDQVAIS